MIVSPRWRTLRTAPPWAGARHALLLVVLALFATVHVLTATPSQDIFAKATVSFNNSTEQASEEITAMIESNESFGSIDLALRSASESLEPNCHSRGQSLKPTYGLKRYWRPGTNGPPAHNTIA